MKTEGRTFMKCPVSDAAIDKYFAEYIAYVGVKRKVKIQGKDMRHTFIQLGIGDLQTNKDALRRITFHTNDA
jgi:hypothetical protein